MAALASNAVWAAPSIVFNPGALNVTKGAVATSPPIVIQSATGVTQVSLNIVLPAGITIDTSTNSSTGNLNCVTPGADTALFFSEWKASTNTIYVSTELNGGDTQEL